MNRSRNTVRILLVEDHYEYAEQFEQWLQMDEEADFRVETVHRLRDALVQLNDGVDIDIIITDLGLPDATGLDAVESLLEAAPHLPLVVLTMSDEPDLCRKAVDIGAQDYIVKGRHTPEHYGHLILQAIVRKQLEDALSIQQDEIELATHVMRDHLKDDLVRLDHIAGKLFDQQNDENTPQGEAQELLARMEDTIDHMETLVDQALRFFQHRRDPTQWQTTSLIDLIRNTTNPYLARAEEAGIEITLRLRSEESRIRCDPVQLQHMLRALLEHTFRRTETSGTRLQVILHEEDPPASNLVLTIQDDAKNVPPEDQKRAFSLLESTTAGSTGDLGLLLAQRVANNHEITITTTNPPAGGNKVTLRFARQASPLEASAPQKGWKKVARSN
jgi:signal transduction histidine kinase